MTFLTYGIPDLRHLVTVKDDRPFLEDILNIKSKINSLSNVLIF
jgi:hypothetical protein